MCLIGELLAIVHKWCYSHPTIKIFNLKCLEGGIKHMMFMKNLNKQII
jgi:hypothetical protein